MEKGLETAAAAAQKVGTGAMIMAFISSFILPSIVGLFFKFFQTLDHISNLQLINIDFGAPVQALFTFLENLQFLPTLRENIWIDLGIEDEMATFPHSKLNEKLGKGFILMSQPLNTMLLIVSIN